MLDKHLIEELERRKTYQFHNGFCCGVGTDLERDYDQATHDRNFVISWMIQGLGSYTEEDTTYPLTDGTVCMRRPGRDYILRLHKRGGIRMFLTIPQDVYLTLLRMIPELAKIPPVWSLPFQRDKAEEFFNLYNRFEEVSSLELHFLFPDMIQYILNITGIQKKRESNPLLLGKRMLEENRSLSVEEIAVRCGMKYHTFRKQFTEQMGMSPGQYRIRKRIESACRFLSDGASVSGTAAHLGYPDVYSFTHQFTSVMGISPGKFREQ